MSPPAKRFSVHASDAAGDVWAAATGGFGDDSAASRAERLLVIIQAMNVECAAQPFQTCGSCRRAWPDWDSFVLDSAVRLLGLQFEITHPDVNLLVFEHGCGSSISILARRLRHLLPEPEPSDPPATLRGTAQCREHCLRLADLEACDAPCSNGRDRKLILLVERMKKPTFITGL